MTNPTSPENQPTGNQPTEATFGNSFSEEVTDEQLLAAEYGNIPVTDEEGAPKTSDSTAGAGSVTPNILSGKKRPPSSEVADPTLETQLASTEATEDSSSRHTERSTQQIDQEIRTISDALRDSFSDKENFIYLKIMRDTYQDALGKSYEAAIRSLSGDEGNKRLRQSLERVIPKVKGLKDKALDDLTDSERDQLAQRYGHNRATAKVGKILESDVRSGIEAHFDADEVSNDDVEKSIEERLSKVKPAIFRVARFSDEEWQGALDEQGDYTPGAGDKLYEALTGETPESPVEEIYKPEPKAPKQPAKAEDQRAPEPQKPEPAEATDNDDETIVIPPAPAVVRGEVVDNHPKPANPTPVSGEVTPAAAEQNDEPELDARYKGLEGHVTKAKHLEVLDQINDFHDEQFDEGCEDAKGRIEAAKAEDSVFRMYSKALGVARSEKGSDLTSDEINDLKSKVVDYHANKYADQRLIARLDNGIFINKLASVPRNREKREDLIFTLMEVGQTERTEWYGYDESGNYVGDGQREILQQHFDIEGEDASRGELKNWFSEKTGKAKSWVGEKLKLVDDKYDALGAYLGSRLFSKVTTQKEGETDTQYEQRLTKRGKVAAGLGTAAITGIALFGAVAAFKYGTTLDSEAFNNFDGAYGLGGESSNEGANDAIQGSADSRRGEVPGSPSDGDSEVVVGAMPPMAEFLQDAAEDMRNFAESVDVPQFDWAEYAEAHPEAVTAVEGEGWDNTFAQFEIDPDHYADLQQQIGDQLKSMGVAMDNPNNPSELWIAQAGELPDDAVELILTTAEQNGWLDTELVTSGASELETSLEAMETISNPFTVEYANGYTHEIIDAAKMLGIEINPEKAFNIHQTIVDQVGSDYINLVDHSGPDTYSMGDSKYDVGISAEGRAQWDDRALEILQQELLGVSEELQSPIDADTGETDITAAPGAAESVINDTSNSGERGVYSGSDLGMYDPGYTGEIDITSAPGAAEFEMNNPTDVVERKLDLEAAREVNPPVPAERNIDLTPAQDANPTEPVERNIDLATPEAVNRPTLEDQITAAIGDNELGNYTTDALKRGNFSLLNNEGVQLLLDKDQRQILGNLAEELANQGATFSNGEPIVKEVSNGFGNTRYEFQNANGASLSPKAERILKSFIDSISNRV